MDISLVRTFLEIAATGSFVGAARRLFVTQSAVSLRVQRLEEALGKALFLRSKAGAELTPAGREFERYALSLVKLWEEARQQVGLPEGFTDSLTIGAQYSLWPRLGFGWLDELRRTMPTLSLRAELGMPDRLTRFLVEGVTQMALIYQPQLRPGLRVEEVMADELVMVAAGPRGADGYRDRYVFVDWGPEFVRAHAMSLPGLTNPGMTLALGALAARFIIDRGLAGYLPARAAKEHLDAGTLHLVPDVPSFPYPAWLAWREDLDETVAASARLALARVAAALEDEQDSVISELDELSAANHAAPGAPGTPPGA